MSRVIVWGTAAALLVWGTGCCKLNCSSCDKDDDDDEEDSSTDTGGGGEDTHTSPLHEPSGWKPSTPVTEPEEEIVLVPEDEWGDVQHSRLYRTGPDGALAAYATGWPSTEIWEAVTDDRGDTWGPNAEPPIASSAVDWDSCLVEFREPSSGLPLMVPFYIDYMDRPALYEWDGEHGWWEAWTLGGCHSTHLGGDAVVDTDSGMTYAACIDVLETRLYKVVDLGYEVDEAAIEPADDVLAAVVPGGRVYFLLLVGAPDNALDIHEYVEEGAGTFTVEDAPMAVIHPDCGDGCVVDSLEQYVIRDGVHHVFVKARLPVLGLWEPPSPTSHPDRGVLLHVSGSPGTSFETHVINVREDGDDLLWLGRVVDIEVSDDAGSFYVTLQDDACLRVLRSDIDAPLWEPLGVVPTFHQPRRHSVLVWDEATIGILDVLPGMRYMGFPMDAGSGACIPPEGVDTSPVDWSTEANRVEVDWIGEQVHVVVDHMGVSGDQNLLCGVSYTTVAEPLGCSSPAADCDDVEVAPFDEVISLPCATSTCHPRVIDLVFSDVRGLAPTVRLAPGADAPVVEDLLGYAGGSVPVGEPLAVAWEPSGSGSVLVEVFDRYDLETPLYSADVDDATGTHTVSRDDLAGFSYVTVRLSRIAEAAFPFPVADGSVIRIQSLTEVELQLLW